MAKSYIDIVKYMVEARFEISGLVEKPDIIGAVFGQTEGLLGSDLDLRELQKNGKIGRIEIETTSPGNRTIGKLHLPSSLGRVETCILAAAIESVDRVGPFETTFKVEKVDDTRNEKRKRIVNRAKELVKSMLTTGFPDSRELSEMVESDIKTSTVITYGPEQLPAGPDIDTSEEIVLVEGRADIVTLLKSDITNCISVGGASGTIPKTIIALCAAKESTLFLDGDRGGDMILKGLTNAAEIDFVARAPDGKEVEELTRKEIIKALRSRTPIEQLFPGSKSGSKPPLPPQRPPVAPQQSSQPRPQPFRREPEPARPAQSTNSQRPTVLSPSNIANNLMGRQQQVETSQEHDIIDSDLGIKDISGSAASLTPRMNIPSIQSDIQPPGGMMLSALDALHNTLRGRLYAESGEVIAEVPIRELMQAVQDTPNVYAVVFDGIITQRLVDIAHAAGVREVYGIRSGQVTKTYDNMRLYTKEHGRA
jgi:DNA primase